MQLSCVFYIKKERPRHIRVECSSPCFVDGGAHENWDILQGLKLWKSKQEKDMADYLDEQYKPLPSRIPRNMAWNAMVEA